MKLTEAGMEGNNPTLNHPSGLTGGDDEPDQCTTYPIDLDYLDEDGEMQINKYTDDDSKQLYSINESPESKPGSKAALGYTDVKLANQSQASLIFSQE